MHVFRNKFCALVLSAVVSVFTLTASENAAALDVNYFPSGDDRPSIVAMGLDFLVVRPLTFVLTVGGGALWFVSLPVSALGGNVEEAADKLVLEPGRYTFVRPLGHMYLDDSPIVGEEKLEKSR